MAEVLRRAVLNEYSALLCRVRKVKLLEVRPSPDGTTRVQGDVLFASTKPARGLWDSPNASDKLSPYDDILRWGKDMRVVAFRLAEEEPASVEVPNWHRDVRQLHFRLQDGKMDSVLDFYRRFGPLGYHCESSAPEFWHPEKWHWEPLGWARAALDTLQHLALLVEWTEKQRTDELRTLFGGPGETNAPEITVGGCLGCDPWQIRWYTWFTSPARDAGNGRAVYRLPEDRELPLAAWEAVLQWFADWFESGKLTVIQHPDKRMIELAVMASSIIEYAIAEFYFDKVSGLKGSCRVCGVPLPTGKNECKRHANTRRVREYRARQGALGALLESAQARIRRRVEKGYMTQEERQRVEQRLKQLAAIGISVDEFQDHVERLVPSMQGHRKRAKPHT